MHLLLRLCAKHAVPATIFAPLCNLAGFALGAGTALLGEKSAMACTIAVEELIGQHYNDQIKDLVEDSPEEHKELLEILTRLRDEELEHHDHGVEHKGLEAPMYSALKNVIQTGCRAAIWVAKRV
ncbi:ubiquinone biosynthesis protein COQ7 domain-containing protein [Ditylenchus destructor]|uniref:Ubiquinone biosynthesis protein COQ7 domain-containing protein n=1 Tax=Ditylenchus destructor TaxID=166010 RepID=A0AAD4MYZ8_9BILA|nr:ubiquinone biosynthesis protein COQ7 domain-containing protein [Ditylenchus destructor]